MKKGKKHNMDMKGQNNRQEVQERIANAGRPDRSHARFYLASVETDHRIYAYETDKQYLLNLIGEQAQRTGYEVIAFVVLDNEYHVILVKSDEPDGSDPNVLKDVQGTYQSYFQEHSGIAGEVKERFGWNRLSGQEVPAECDRLHRLAVDKGYVDNPADFWWSSMNHYKGRYEWHFLNMWWLFALQAADERTVDPDKFPRHTRKRSTGR